MPVSPTKKLTVCALLTALSVVLARLIIPMPNEFTRFSIEAVPIFLAGMLFGPIYGGVVGFSADLIGCLFSGYGYNPLFCLPPILYGICAGLFRKKLCRKPSVAWISLSFALPVVFGSVLWQSFTLAYVYGKGGLLPAFVGFLGTRSIQFAVTLVLDVLLVFLLQKSGALEAAHLLPANVTKKEQI